MPDQKQPQVNDDRNDAPAEVEESGAGYGNNAGQQGKEPQKKD